ncbi:hypothetical protein F5Y00DRAFT_252718 [Daldinia vernicosa]|uniref:uncharacterized protein n=1 Tax=Daldinia vernicosa TaxID=114800 RepID=UPI0020079E47|nr:uncharacterized protein F5Y00DRAFT_252718 [Daldinia vernicosa]KAI0849534.1 hypothetical protein F5Y00DRAFT_252718 [Daldinia vernicosa]
MHTSTVMEAALLERVGLLQRWHSNVDEAERTMETQPLYIRLWSKLGAGLKGHDRPGIEVPADETVTVGDLKYLSRSALDAGEGSPGCGTSMAETDTSNTGYRGCYVCNGHECPLPQPDLSQIPVPAWAELGKWTAHRLQRPTAYEFNKEFAAARFSVALAAKTAAGGGTEAVKGASRNVQLRSFSKITGSKTMWAEYDLMTSVWLSFTVVSLYRSSGMQPILAFQQAAMACTIPDYDGTPDGEDPKYAAAALEVSTHGFDIIAKHNEKGTAGAEMIAAALTRPGYGRYTKLQGDTGHDLSAVDRNMWLHMRWYDGGVVPYFMCHDWSLESELGRRDGKQICHLVNSCYDVTIWLNDLSDYALDRTIGEGGNSLVYAVSQSGESNPSVLADYCSAVIDRVCECTCGSRSHTIAADIAVGFTAMYSLAFRYRGFENAWLARSVELSGIVQRGWLIRGGSRAQWPRVPYRSDWGPLSTEVPAEIDLETSSKCWQARCGRLAESGPGQRLVNHILTRYIESRSYDRIIVLESLHELWLVAEPAVSKLGGNADTIYTSVEMFVLSVLDWPAIFTAPGREMGQCAVRDKVTLENILLESAAYGLWCCGTSETSDWVRFLTGLVASVAELTVVATYRRIPTLWSDNGVAWEPMEHKDCTHPPIID